MTHFKLFGAALILAMAFATPSFAQVNLPGDYSFFSPKDDFGPAVQAIQPSRAVNVGGLRVPGRSFTTSERTEPALTHSRRADRAA